MRLSILLSFIFLFQPGSKLLANNDLALPMGYTVNELNLIKVKIINGDKILSKQFQSMLEQAQAFMEIEPPSVIDDSSSPLGADSHDYVSYAPYWWPNPSTKTGLPYVRRDGEINHELRDKGDDKAFTKMANAVHLLALAYFYSDKEKYALKAAQFIDVWFLDTATYMNPNAQGGQIILGKKDFGRRAGINELRFLSNVLDAIKILESSKTWTSEREVKIKKWFSDYLKWLEKSDHGEKEKTRPNNHGTWYDVQYISLAIYLEQMEKAKNHLKKYSFSRIDKQIKSNGEQPLEVTRGRSLHYSLYNIRAFFALAAYAKQVGIDLWNYQSPAGSSIKVALDYLTPYIGNQSNWPFQDLGSKEPKKWELLLSQAFFWSNDERYQKLLNGIEAKYCYPNCFYQLVIPSSPV
ncbi:MAG: alginate lyase family protein [Bacteroidetes bacterium]|nr:alginate lyase family protein [Bacteroidota bacterium]